MVPTERLQRHDIELLVRLRRWCQDGTARSIRKAARLSQRELAEALGTDGGTLSHWETGRRVPRSERAIAYAKRLDRLADATGAE
jgi:transcriptional regulator with XRE-family HTH domain